MSRFPFSVAMSLVDRAALITGVDPSCVIKWDRRRPVVRTRWAVMWALRQMGLTQTSIARHVGQQDHTTVIHGVREAERLRGEDQDFKVLTDHLLIYGRSLQQEEVAA